MTAPSLSPKELASLEDCILIDLRSPANYAYDTIPGARNLKDLLAQAQSGALTGADFRKKLVLFCSDGEESLRTARALCDLGFDAVSLEGGFSGYIRANLPQRDLSGDILKDLSQIIR